MVKIHVFKKFTKQASEDLNYLASILHETGKKTSSSAAADLKGLLKNKHAALLVASDNSKIIGMTMLFEMQKIGRKTGSIEDVVVLESHRGQGIGEKLMRLAITEGKKRKLRSLGLTSRASRVAANKLYQKLGFELRETNVYKYSY